MKLTITAIVLLIFFMTSGCTLLKVREEVKDGEQATVLAGIVTIPPSLQGKPVVVLAYSRTDGDISILHYTTLHEPGPYELMVPAQPLTVVSFVDENGNFVYDEGEVSGEIYLTGQGAVDAGGVIGNMDVVVSRQNSTNVTFPRGFRLPPKKYVQFHSTSPGAIAHLDDDIFSADFGHKGFWTPMDFFKELGGNVYFLEAYTPEKIPVLFVHGAGGTPRDFRNLIGALDQDRYQPWFFYYPSGASMDAMSYLLLWKLMNLQIKYKFKTMYITAHSMGGLVVRSFFVNYGQLFPSITNFISISTPWGGEKLAELGVKYSPGVVTAWRDMQPGSEFLASIYKKPMPPTVDHYLFFGHKGSRNLWRPNNDKVVTLASQLDQRSQKGARMIYGFDEDHVSILSSRQAISQYNAILADASQTAGAEDRVSGNRLRVYYSFDFPEDQPKPMPTLLLRPAGKEGEETWVGMGHGDSGKEHGPFPPGSYEVSLVAPAFESSPLRQMVSIEDGRIPSLSFTMKPVGILRGYIVKPDQDYIQAGKYQQQDVCVPIQSVTLKGNGINRTLTPVVKGRSWGDHDPLIPLQEEDVSFGEYLLSGTDFTVNGIFFFFDLPAGRYTLTIKAKGYSPYSEIYHVIPGQYQNTLQIHLSKPSDSGS